MRLLQKGRYLARLAETRADLEAAQRLRYRCFVDAQGQGLDHDRFDALCRHVLIEEMAGGELVGCFRMLKLSDGKSIGKSYAAQYYALDALKAYPGRMIELGRFCIAPERFDADILRVAWAALTRVVADDDIGMLFGCVSFKGTDTGAYQDAFSLLQDRHLAPSCWLPRIKAPDVFRFTRHPGHQPDVKRALKALPPLLRTYLNMGGWVSDHAVLDRELNTIHVFTGLELSAVPPRRARLLRTMAA